LEILLQYLNYSDSNDIQNLKLLYRISFIKIYFKYFVDIMYESKNDNEIINFDHLVNEQFLLKIRKLDIISEMISNLKIKCGNNFETFILDNKITYLQNNSNSQKNKISYYVNNIPNKQLLKYTFNKIDTNKKKHPLLNQYLNNEKQINYLKNLPIINYFSNVMLNIYNYKYSPEKIKETILEGEIDKIKNYSPELYNNFELIISEYIQSYNNLLDENNSNYKIDENYKNQLLKIFLVNEHNKNNQLNNILNNFIKYQNDLISNISEKYYRNINIEEINVQDAKEENIPKFSSSDNEFLEIIMSNILVKFVQDNNEFNFNFDFEEIEKYLVQKIKPGLKRFVPGKIRTIKYCGNLTNDEIIMEFTDKYKSKDINKEQLEHINQFIKNSDSEKLNTFILLLQKIMLFILSQFPSFNAETDLNNVIEKMQGRELDQIRYDIIKSFIKEDEDEEDDIDKLNDNLNGNNCNGFSVDNLYPIYREIEKSINSNK